MWNLKPSYECPSQRPILRRLWQVQWNLSAPGSREIAYSAASNHYADVTQPNPIAFETAGSTVHNNRQIVYIHSRTRRSFMHGTGPKLHSPTTPANHGPFMKASLGSPRGHCVALLNSRSQRHCKARDQPEYASNPHAIQSSLTTPGFLCFEGCGQSGH